MIPPSLSFSVTKRSGCVHLPVDGTFTWLGRCVWEMPATEHGNSFGGYLRAVGNQKFGLYQSHVR